MADLTRIATVPFDTAGARHTQIDAGIGLGAGPTTGGATGTAQIGTLAPTRTERLDRTAGIDATGAPGTDRGAATIDQTTLVAVGTALRSGRRVADAVGRGQATRLAIGGAAEFFAITGALATGVVTTLAIAKIPLGNSGRAAGWAGARVALRRSGRAGADPIDGRLAAGTANRCWGGRGPARGFGIALQRCPSDQGRTAEAKQPLQDAAPAFARGERSHERIEATIVHIEPPGDHAVRSIGGVAWHVAGRCLLCRDEVSRTDSCRCNA